MAVRWGAGEETLTTCNMDIFPLDTLDETTVLRSEGTLDTLQSCLDPTILSMFEDTPAIETRDFEDETEATLLTALTEILDNVDDENLSPFDTLPETDLLSGQKGREHSPLRRLFCLSRSPPEKDVIFGKPRSTGKTLPMVQQRSDGEEEEDSLSLSPGRLELSSDNELFDWEGLPITLEQHGEDGLSVNLGELVKHMHPYCMTIALEDDNGEQMLPEGGILLEVVDQGENGEPILAIPEVNHPVSVKLDDLSSNSKALDEADDQASDTSEHIVVDDDDDQPPAKDEVNKTCSNVKDIMDRDDHKNDLYDKNASQRKNKFNSLAACPQPTESRVLHRSSKKKASNKQPKKSEKKFCEDSVAAQDLYSTNTISLFTKPKNVTISQSESSDSMTGAIVPLLPKSSKQAEKDQSESPPKAECIEQSESISNFVAPAPESEEGISAEPTSSKGNPSTADDQAASAEVTHTTTSISEPSLPLPPAVTAEPKPKALSLAEYRRLRQQKKPAPIEKQDDNSTKWPSLPELPRELPPIPHLPEPSPRDPRRSRPQSKEVEEVKPAWMPRGPCAPPTPEALLAPPAYMVNSTVNRISAPTVPKPPQTVSQTAPSQHFNNDNTLAAALPTQESTKGDESCATDSSQTCETSAVITTDEIKTAAILTSISYNAAASPEMQASMKSTGEPPRSIDSCGQGFSSSVTVVKLPNQRTPDKSEKSQVATLLQPKNPTLELIEAFTSEMGIEATDLTSLLEQFEKTQAKEEQCVPEVSGRAVAVGNSSSDMNSEKKDLERVKANDLSSAALTPPGTPPHPMWKPLVPVSLLGKSKAAETKLGLSKVIEIEAQPLPSTKARNKFAPATAAVAPDMASHDHDYCLPNKGTSTGEAGKRWNVKQNSSITIIPLKQPSIAVTVQQQLDLKTEDLEKSSVLETPDASPTREVDANNSTCTKQEAFGRSYRRRATSHTLSPKRSVRRPTVRRSHRSQSPSSDSSESDSSRSRSRSYTPPKKRYRPRRSRSSSSSRSCSRSSSRSQSPSRSPRRRRRYSYSSSRSASWSRSRSHSRSRSRSPQWSRKRRLCSPSYRDVYGSNVNTDHELKRRKGKAIEERRVVYVGRIRGTMTQKELKERFSYFGEIEECTLHFRDHGDNYGFVTYYNTNDAFMAIENGGKLRKPDELPFDLCFGGRRQFCQASYADLDSSKEYDPLPSRNKTHALDFDTLLKQAKQNLKR